MSDNNLSALEKRIQSARQKTNPAPQKQSDYKKNSGIVVEFIAGIIVPPFLGYWIDVKMNTMPLFLIFFLVLGFIGSVYNIYKSSQNLDGTIGISGLPENKKDGK